MSCGQPAQDEVEDQLPREYAYLRSTHLQTLTLSRSRSLLSQRQLPSLRVAYDAVYHLPSKFAPLHTAGELQRPPSLARLSRLTRTSAATTSSTTSCSSTVEASTAHGSGVVRALHRLPSEVPRGAKSCWPSLVASRPGRLPLSRSPLASARPAAELTFDFDTGSFSILCSRTTSRRPMTLACRTRGSGLHRRSRAWRCST